MDKVRYYVIFSGDAATLEPIPPDVYLDKFGLGSGEGYTYDEARDRIAEHYSRLSSSWRVGTHPDAMKYHPTNPQRPSVNQPVSTAQLDWNDMMGRN
jgi:hypothetical protein